MYSTQLSLETHSISPRPRSAHLSLAPPHRPHQTPSSRFTPETCNGSWQIRRVSPFVICHCGSCHAGRNTAPRVRVPCCEGAFYPCSPACWAAEQPFFLLASTTTITTRRRHRAAAEPTCSEKPPAGICRCPSLLSQQETRWGKGVHDGRTSRRRLRSCGARVRVLGHCRRSCVVCICGPQRGGGGSADLQSRHGELHHALPPAAVSADIADSNCGLAVGNR